MRWARSCLGLCALLVAGGCQDYGGGDGNDAGEEPLIPDGDAGVPDGPDDGQGASFDSLDLPMGLLDGWKVPADTCAPDMSSCQAPSFPLPKSLAPRIAPRI